MKKIVPFKKDIIFSTEIMEITSISLDHHLEKKEKNKMIGKFKVYGDYKATDVTTTLDNFSYDLPFEINLDEKYDVTNAEIEIDDFYYEIVNNKVLTVSIDVLLNNLEEKEVITLEEKEEEKRCIEEEVQQEVTSKEEIYKSYKVYIVRENDTLETIMEKYNITKEELEEYNDIATLNINDKIIIPCKDETNS
jgi:LysM repeat protein